MAVTTLEHAGSTRAIPYPTQHSEFEVQAWLYMALREAGIDVRGEVKTMFAPKSRGAKAQFCRFDLVVFTDGKATRVIEVKAADVRHKTGVDNTRQATRYRTYGVPVTFAYGMDGAEHVLREISSPASLTSPPVPHAMAGAAVAAQSAQA